MAILEVSHIEKHFAQTPVLKDISFSMEQGQAIAIIGSSGSGKTTLLRCLNFLERPDGGVISLRGEPLLDASRPPDRERDLRRKRLHFGLVFQDFNLFPQYTALENVTLARRLARRDGETEQDIWDRGLDLLDQMGLSDRAGHYPHQLSGGQKQRVALARTMVMKPRILLLDEPLSALDGVIKESIKEKIKEIAREFKLTTIIVTHDPEEALTLSDKVLIVNEGNIAQFGRPEEIIGQPADSFVKNFILNQLEVKRNNIFTLFSREMTRSSSQRISCTA